MKKSTRIVKRVLALFLVVLMSIESFGAVVSDNDGSAFITKAEFDSLKNNFQSQIDQYNTSIDSKIDGAIASYLAGINVAKQTSKSLIVKSWTTGVVSMNGVQNNTFQLPDVSGALGLFEEYYAALQSDGNIPTGENIGINLNSAWGEVGTGEQIGGKIVWMDANFNWKNSSKVNHYRNLVENVTLGTTLDVSKMTWAGVANNVTEEWTLSKLVRYARNAGGINTTHDPGYLENRYNINFILSTMLNLNAPGYVSSFIDKSNPLWLPTIRWYVRNSSGGRVYDNNWNTGECISVSTIPSVKYEKDNNGNTYSYQHIVNWRANSSWEVAVKNATNYLKTTSNNALRTNNWVNQVVTYGYTQGEWAGTEIFSGQNTRGGDSRGRSHIAGWITNGIVQFSDNKSSSGGPSNVSTIPVIGLIGNYPANEIYQFSDGDLYDDEGNKIAPIKLQEGLPIMRVSEDETIEWTPVFKNISVTGQPTISECYIILSYKPFTDFGSLSNNDDYVKMDGIAKGSWAATTSKKVKIKFEADRNSYVYAKWVPKTDWTTINGSTYWETTLDIENCSTYTSIKE